MSHSKRTNLILQLAKEQQGTIIQKDVSCEVSENAVVNINTDIPADIDVFVDTKVPKESNGVSVGSNVHEEEIMSQISVNTLSAHVINDFPSGIGMSVGAYVPEEVIMNHNSWQLINMNDARPIELNLPFGNKKDAFQTLDTDVSNFVPEKPLKEKDSNLDSEESLSDPYSSDDSVADSLFTTDGSCSSSSTDSDNNEVVREINNDASNKRRLVQHPSLVEKTVRKRQRDQDKWQKNKAKRLRNRGLSYKSIRLITKDDGTKEKVQIIRNAKKLLPPCNDKCRLKCSIKLSEECRQKIFNEYWDMANLQRQRDFISTCIEPVNPKYRYEKADSCRRLNNAFYFHSDGQKIRVCKQFFMSTLSINSRIIRTVIEKQESLTKGIIEPELRGKHGNHAKVSEDIKIGVRNHIKSIPRIESHYCRSQTSKEYIEGGKSVAELYRDYKLSCEEENSAYANYAMYYSIFNNEFNIGFFNPKKDQCELCLAYTNANEEEKLQLKGKYDTHIREKDLSRVEKEKDKQSNCVVAVYDLQAVLPCPVGAASSFYYVSKLNVFNLTMFELKTNEVRCYLWHEGQANRGANEIGTCVWRYLKSLEDKKQNEKIDVVFYSDNCAGQNKNKFILALYTYAVSKLEYINSITHKFLITGHTQNEGDSAHSIIERTITKFKKSAPIYVPEQYVTLIRQAKKTGKPYKNYVTKISLISRI